MTPDELAAIRARDAELDLDAIYMPESHTDRRALLAEVDRLAYYERAWRDDFAEVTRAERARIRAGVEGLRDLDKLSPMEQRVWGEACAAVLALFDGGEKP